MPNTIITPTIIAKEALFQLKNMLVMGKLVHRDYTKEFVHVGASINVRKPVKFVDNAGFDITDNIQNVSEANISITIDQARNVAWEFGSSDLSLSVEKFSERYIQPAVLKLANRIDYTLTGLYTDVYNTAGTAGTTPSTFAAIGDLNKKMDFGAVPKPRNLVLDPNAAWDLADGLKGIYNAAMAKEMVAEGVIHRVGGMTLFEDQNVRLHSPNTLTGTPVIDTVSSVTFITSGQNATTSTVHVDGISAGAVKAGDIFTIAGVNSVNPVSYQDTGNLQEFTVTATVAQATDMPLVVRPAIYASGAYQSVTADPADGAAVTFYTAHTANLGFHKNAFALVFSAIEPLTGQDSSNITDPASGVSIRVTHGSNILQSKNITRLDILFGVKAIYPDLAARLMG